MKGKNTVPGIRRKKEKGEKIVALTAYDYTLAHLVDEGGVDMILVGDTVGMVTQGHSTTLPVTLEEIIYHSKTVRRANPLALVVGDLPFMSYQSSIEDGIRSSGRLIKEGGVEAVKLEGGANMAPTIKNITAVDIPVIGHIGLTPQSFHRMGGHKIQGKRSRKSGNPTAGTREQLLEDALAVEEAGAFALVIEGVPAELAGEITEKLSIPTIGIAAGPYCDGQILVTHDLLGLTVDGPPKFVERYANLGEEAIIAIRKFVSDVKEKKGTREITYN